MASSSAWPAGKKDPLLPQFYTKRDLDVDDAESTVLETIEGRGIAEGHETQQEDEKDRFFVLCQCYLANSSLE